MADTKRAQTEFTSFAYCKEASYGELSATAASNLWYYFEPDSIGDFGQDYIRERRDPLAVDRLMRKQQLTGVSAMAAFEMDATDGHLDWLMPMAMLADWQTVDIATESGATHTRWSGTVATATASGNKIVVPAGSGADNLAFRNRILSVAASTASPIVMFPYISGASEPPPELRGKVFALEKQTAAGEYVAKELVRSGTDKMISEKTATTAIANDQSTPFFICVIGVAVKGKASSSPVLSSTGLTNVPDMTADALYFDMPGRGIYVTIGKQTSSTEDVADTDQSAAGLIGFARLSGVTSSALSWEVPDASGSSVTLDATTDRAYIFFSKWIKNVPADNTAWNDDSYSLVAKYANINNDGHDVYEHMRGCHLNNFAMRLSQQARIRVSMDFVGSQKQTLATGAVPSNFAAAKKQTSQEAISTSVDIGRAKLLEAADGSDIATLLKGVDIQMGNSLEGDYILDSHISVGPQIGKFSLMASANAMLVSRDNFVAVEQDTVGSFQLAAGTDEGWWMFDIPACTLTSDRKNFERNRTLTIDYQLDYFPDETYQTGLIVTRFPWLPIRKSTDN